MNKLEEMHHLNKND